jgi:autotransporter translocation and assembly factor TamB
MEARIDSLTLETRRVGLGPHLEINDLSLGSTAELSPSQPARLTVQELAAVVRGTLADSTSVRSWALGLDHLGLGAQVLADTNAAGNLRLVSARLDSLFLDLAPVGPMAESGGWMPKDALSLDVTAGVTREESAYDAELSVDFALPGTAHFDLAGRYDDPQVTGDLHIDIEETTWVEAGRLEVHIDADREALAAGDLSGVVAVADSFALGVTGLGLFMDGGVDQGDLDLHLVLGIDDLGLARLIVPEISEDDSLVVGADLLLEGTLDQPRVTGFVEGGARVLDYSVPSLRLDLGGDAFHVTADLAAGGGLELAGTSLDSVTAFVHGLRDTSGAMEADFALGAWGREFSTSLGGYATWDSVRTLRIDSLAVRTPEGALDLEDPVTLTQGPGDQDIALSSLLITGDPGNLELEGYRTAEELTSRVLADLLLTEAMLQFVAPSPLWSLEGGQDLSVEADIDLGGTSDNPEFTGNSRVRLIPHRDKPPLGVNLDLSLAGGDDGGLTAVMGFTSADTVMLEGTTTWPGRVDLVAGTWKPDRDRDMTLEIPRQRMDLARFNRLLPDDVEMKGSCELSANVALPRLGSDEGADPLENGRLDFRFETQKLRVDLPNRSRIDFTMNIEASGNLKDPLVKGRVEVGSAFFRIPEIPRNLHPMEAPSMLWALRDSVAARLDSTMALADSFDVFAIPEAEGPILGPKGPGYLPELDLQILIPRNVRITGYGMDLEIEGDIKVARGFDEDGRPGPALTGFVRIRQGTLQFMNRVFKPERGQVDFTGTVPPDPRLDLMLEANVSGTIVRILVSGSASDPVIDLTSEPEMPQEDVVSVLLFGRPLNDLDTDQRNNMDDGGDPAKELRENLAGLAMVFGTAGLQNQMSNTLGVDMVQLGSDSSGGSTLMVGKFISPNLMVKYHASLEKSGTYFMTLEYTLSRFFKLVTTYGQGDEASGAELQWSKRY